MAQKMAQLPIPANTRSWVRMVKSLPGLEVPRALHRIQTTLDLSMTALLRLGIVY